MVGLSGHNPNIRALWGSIFLNPSLFWTHARALFRDLSRGTMAIHSGRRQLDVFVVSATLPWYPACISPVVVIVSLGHL